MLEKDLIKELEQNREYIEMGYGLALDDAIAKTNKADYLNEQQKIELIVKLRGLLYKENIEGLISKIVLIKKTRIV